MAYTIPEDIVTILETLEATGFEAFVVGGSVRDLLLGREVTDWDITTSAEPEKVQGLFEDSFYENEFGTVGVKIRNQESRIRNQELEEDKKTEERIIKEKTTQVVEVTTYRKEEEYSDKRHPDEITFTGSLEEDLARRDFTINALAARIKNYELGIKERKIKKKGSLFTIPDSLFEIKDPYNGQKDLEKKLVRSVGDPSDRFTEDALRLMRAVRFTTQLGFSLEAETQKAIKNNAGGLADIANERIRDELIKIINTDDAEGAEKGVRLLHELGLLAHIMPELEEGVGVEQSGHHDYTVFEHNVRSLGYAAQFGYSTEVRLAALLHDVGKPRSKRGEGDEATFYGHDVIGARMAKKILSRLRFPKSFARKVVKLVRYHMFYYDVGEVTETSVRRLISKVGKDDIDELLAVRIAERKGSGVPKAEPYRLRHLRYMIDKVSRDPLSTRMLAIDGNDIIKNLGIQPGPRVGMLLNALLEEVLDDPDKNTTDYLASRADRLNELSDADLKAKATAGKTKLEEREEEIDKRLKDKYYVQ